MPTSQGARPAAFYVTFSGEAAKGGPTPIDNVVGLDADGRVAVPAVLGHLADGLRLHILRGMAFGPDGNLYVANAHKTNSMILAFGPPGSDGVRPMAGDGPVARHGRHDAALVHPYGLVHDRHGHLLVTVQDTVVVTRFTPDHRLGPVADFLREEFEDIDFLPGTHVAGAVDAAHLPDPVPVHKGGLRRPRGIAYCARRHAIYVADEEVGAVRSYSADTGHFLGDVVRHPAHHGQPVGLHVVDDTLYVGLKGADRVLAAHLGDGSVETVVHGKQGGVHLRHPSGIATGADGALYVASHDGRQVLRYDLADGSADVFADGLTDLPEDLLAVPDPPPGASHSPTDVLAEPWGGPPH